MNQHLNHFAGPFANYPKNVSLTLQALKNSKEILCNRKKWTKESFARTADGSSCSSIDPKAECFCLLGATYRAKNDLGVAPEVSFGIVTGYYVQRALDSILGARDTTPPEYNDDPARTYEEVMEVLDLAIKMCELDLAEQEKAISQATI